MAKSKAVAKDESKDTRSHKEILQQSGLLDEHMMRYAASRTNRLDGFVAMMLGGTMAAEDVGKVYPELARALVADALLVMGEIDEFVRKETQAKRQELEEKIEQAEAEAVERALSEEGEETDD